MQVQKCNFPLPKWVQNTHRAPQNPPECQISSKCQCFICNIKYLALRRGVGGFELGGELSEIGWGGGVHTYSLILDTIASFLTIMLYYSQTMHCAHSFLQVPTGLQIVDKVFQFTQWP